MQSVIGIAGPVILGVAASWLAWRIRIPSILLLLLVGVVCGPVLGWISPDKQFGDLVEPFVSLSVTLILFEGGMTLRLRDLREVGPAIRNLVALGVPVTWGLIWAACRWILGMSSPVAAVCGAILVVSGPTVIVPLLHHVRLSDRLARTVKWEGILNDGLGALLAVLVLGAVLAGRGPSNAALFFLGSLFSASLIGVAMGGLLVLLLRLFWIPDSLHNPVAVASVFGAYILSNLIQPESGLLAVTVMGVAVANQPWISVRSMQAFKEELRSLLIPVLFIVLAARLRLADVQALGWSTAVFLALLVFFIRPATVFLSTAFTALTTKERLFLSWMAPRGVVAAAVSPVFAERLSRAGFDGAGLLTPTVFAGIIATVAIYGLSADPVARRLGLAAPNPQGVLILGAQPWARALAAAIRDLGHTVVLVDSNWGNVTAARMEGFQVHYGGVLSRRVLDNLDLFGIGKLLALTSNDESNSLACLHFRDEFGRANVFQIAPAGWEDGKARNELGEFHGRILFGKNFHFQSFTRLFERGAEIKTTPLTEEFDFEELQRRGDGAVYPLLIHTKDSGLRIVTAAEEWKLRPGDSVVTIQFAHQEDAGALREAPLGAPATL